MTAGKIETSDGDTLLGIYNKFTLQGEQKEPLTHQEMSLLYRVAYNISRKKIINAPERRCKTVA